MKPDTAQTCSADLSFRQIWARPTYQNWVECSRPLRVNPFTFGLFRRVFVICSEWPHMGSFVLKRVFPLSYGRFSPGFVSRAKFRENEKFFEASEIFTAHGMYWCAPDPKVWKAEPVLLLRYRTEKLVTLGANRLEIGHLPYFVFAISLYQRPQRHPYVLWKTSERRKTFLTQNRKFYFTCYLGQSNSADSSQNRSVFAAKVEKWPQENGCNFVHRAPFSQKFYLSKAYHLCLLHIPHARVVCTLMGFRIFWAMAPFGAIRELFGISV